MSIRKAEEKTEEVSRPQREYKPSQRSSAPAPRKTTSYSRDNNARGDRFSQGQESKKDSFDSLMSAFLKDSDDRLTSLKRNTEGKRGGRGGRRS